MDDNIGRLVWSPIGRFLADELGRRAKMRLLIVPFVQLGALQELLDSCAGVENLEVVTRWNENDIVTGVSDPEIYPYLKKRRIPLYIHRDIHLKLCIFDGAQAFHTSANVTARGLGSADKRNVEIGCLVDLVRDDWRHIFELLEASTRVDDSMYEKTLAYERANAMPRRKLPKLDLVPSNDRSFSILSLPATENPELLYEIYGGHEKADGEAAAAAAHDLLLYGIPDGLGKGEFYDRLRAAFRRHPFTKALVSLLKKEVSARFGLVNQWVQELCADKPTPYRWELKTNTRKSYNWLAFFFDEITWDRPSHSQVIRWNSQP